MDSDDDLVVVECKKKLLQFRLKELKDVLTQVGLSKQGKKQDLTDRILALLYDEGTPGVFKNNVNGKDGLVKIINEAYRSMHDTGVIDANAKKENVSSSSKKQSKEETSESKQCIRSKIIRCPCGSTGHGGSTFVQCMDPDCNLWQHGECVIVPDKPLEKISLPSLFYCEVCRLKRADPFWVTVAHPLDPVKLKSSVPLDGTNPIQSLETSFMISKADREILQKTDYDVQAWCMLFNDSVPFRMQWPKYADLQINGIPVRAVNRPGSQTLGANGRDDGAKITLYVVEGMNRISLSGSDARLFCLGVRLVRRRTLDQVLGLIPKELDGESFEDALARVQRCIGGGMAADNSDSDSDLEVIADAITVNLRCPMSGSRIKTAGRFKPCVHMGCFDLETFVELNERSRKWQCPICLKNYSLEDIIVDPFFNRIVTMMRSCGEEINEIDLKPDGSWRVKKAREGGDLAQWHRSDGSLEVVTRPEVGNEDVSRGDSLKVGVHNDVGNGRQDDEGECYPQNIITMSSTTTDNDDGDGEPSINQDGREQLGNENEITSGFEHSGQSQRFNTDADVIILSDSDDDDDDDVSLIHPEPSHEADHTVNVKYPPPFPAKIIKTCDDEPSEGLCGLNENDIALLNSLTSLPSNSHGGSGIDFLQTASAVVDNQDSASCAEPVNCMIISEPAVDPVCPVVDSYETHNSSVEHQFLSVSENVLSEVHIPGPSVSLNELPLQSWGPGENGTYLTGVGTGQVDSISNVDVLHEPATESVPELPNQYRPDGDSLMEGARVEPESRSDLTVNKKRSDGPFSFPRHPRSTRRRLGRSLNNITEQANMLQ